MNRKPVTSSNIVSIGYQPGARILEVEFKGGSVYQYANVPPSEHVGLMNAESHGAYLAKHIKGVYTATKL